MLKVQLAQRWERLGNRDTDFVGMLLLALLAGLFAWGAYVVAYPEHGCVRMGKGNSGRLECNPSVLMMYACWLLLISAIKAYCVFFILWGLLKDMARPLTLDGETASSPDADRQGP